jgi:two-component system sensor histidine kinase UhpB
MPIYASISIGQSARMSRLPLIPRILILILAVQVVLFAALAAASLDTIRRDIATETRLASETARALVLATVGTMQTAVPADRLMALLPERLAPPRHTSIAVLDARDGIIRPVASPVESLPHAPQWFARLVAPRPLEMRLPVHVQNRPRGYVYVSSDPSAEIAAAWRTIRLTLGLAGLAALAQMVLILIVSRHALRPVATIARRLGDLRRGELDARIGPLPQTDLAPLAAGVDALAQDLQQAQRDRAQLQRDVVSRGDAERKAIARDLHDEMGPCLFGLRVEADALREAGTDSKIAEHADAIRAIADEISRVNRALLDDLRPVAIGQLPLSMLLSDYVDDLRRRFPDTRFDLTLAADLSEPDEATALTLFRILQEGTTNALRHADCDRIDIRLWTDPAHWRMILADDGTGLPPDLREGKGLTGMRERITLLGGELDLSSTTTGTTIAARLPLTQPPEART